MAPNLKHLPLQSPTGLTTKVVAVVAKDYQQRPAPVVDSASYWEWNEPADVLSTNHIISNFVKAGEAVMMKGNTIKNTDITISSSDDYWAENVQDDLHDQVAKADSGIVSHPLQQAVESANCWDEASHSRSASDNYWDTSAYSSVVNNNKVPYPPVASIRNPALHQPDESATYWQERSHESSTSSSEQDAYWRESRPSESFDENNYWTWKASELTESDKYWAWPTSAA